jgi:N-acetylglucosaminyldiphosphoundecaprenol N-acetyl-beta-D-mannosaminyltransferase
LRRCATFPHFFSSIYWEGVFLHMKDLKTQEIMGVHFISSTFNETLEHFIECIEAGKTIRVITANPEMIMLARQDESFKEILYSADFVTPDGIGVILAGKILNRPLKERITGYDLTVSLLSVANEKNWRVYFLGASPEVMDLLRKKIVDQYPGINLMAHHGYFSTDDEERIVDEIRNHHPHLLLVGLGMQKQELFLQKYLSHLPVQFAMGVGGTFDVLSGKVKRAPLLWQRLGVEWLYRLIKEPWRWKRMLALPKFLFIVINHRLRGSK